MKKRLLPRFVNVEDHPTEVSAYKRILNICKISRQKLLYLKVFLRFVKSDLFFVFHTFQLK